MSLTLAHKLKELEKAKELLETASSNVFEAFKIIEGLRPENISVKTLGFEMRQLLLDQIKVVEKTASELRQGKLPLLGEENAQS